MEIRNGAESRHKETPGASVEGLLMTRMCRRQGCGISALGEPNSERGMKQHFGFGNRRKSETSETADVRELLHTMFTCVLYTVRVLWAFCEFLVGALFFLSINGLFFLQEKSK